VQPGELAAAAADGGTDGFDDDGFGHWAYLLEPGNLEPANLIQANVRLCWGG
jgi:hypothetical protein